MHAGVAAVFALVYLGMFLGGLPTLRLNRAGVALLGAIAVIGMGALTVEQAVQAVDAPTLLLLFAFMVMAAQLRMGGFYGAVVDWVGARPLSPRALLGALIGVAALLSAVFSNDVICLAMTPVVLHLCQRRRLQPVPYLLALAAAANIGSAATLIGNPQNMLIGSVLRLPFGLYVAAAAVPVGVSLLVLWGWLARQPLASGGLDIAHDPAPVAVQGEPAGLDPQARRWQTAKGLTVAACVLGAFLWAPWPRDVVALTAAGVLLLSRHFHSSDVMGQVDWELLVLFAGLFVVNAAFAHTGLAQQAVQALAAQGVCLSDTGPLFAAGLLLSNLVSNVPAVMLLLPHLGGQDPMAAGLTLALVSTLAGNLLLVGSIANLIVADLAAQQGVRLDWRTHAQTGVPVTLLTLGVVAVWLRWWL